MVKTPAVRRVVIGIKIEKIHKNVYLLLFLWVFFLPPLPKGRGTAAQAVVEGYIPQSFAYGEIQPPFRQGGQVQPQVSSNP